MSLPNAGLTIIASGHPKIRATHKTTLEFTRDKEVSERGDCVVAVNADFKKEDLQKLIHTAQKIRIVISADSVSDEIIAYANSGFDDDKEIVVRMGSFSSSRTLGVRASKSAKYLSRNLVEKLKVRGQKVVVTIEPV